MKVVDLKTISRLFWHMEGLLGLVIIMAIYFCFELLNQRDNDKRRQERIEAWQSQKANLMRLIESVFGKNKT